MNYNRPTVGSLEAWAEAVNDTGYTWDNFLPYFEGSISYSNPNMSMRASNSSVPFIDPVNQTGNPLEVSFPNFASPLASWAQLAFRELGVADVHDLISGQLLGSQYSPLTLKPKDQSRSSSQTSYLDAAFAADGVPQTNLKIYTHALGQNILFDNNKTAYGVSVQSGPAMAPPYVLTASNEVIVSAGAFQSPQLLMVSGVGPAETLQKYNIPIVADRPGVGQNMWDHVVLSVGYQVSIETYGRLMNHTLASKAELDYALSQAGILTNDQSDYLGWEKLPAATRVNFSNSTRNALSAFPPDWPEVEYEVSSAPFGTPPFSTPERPIDVGYLQPVLLTPLSRGNVSISSARMTDPPIISPNWLTNPTDQEVAIATLKRGREFFNTSAIAPILIGDELLPGQDLPVDSTDEEILAYLQKNLGFNWHASCTCKMGRGDDEMAVVDSKARVFGVNRLRVVDASAFPLLPPGHPQATVYALAEKIAADILIGR
jgi:choline dehydrogenase